jgi:superoxide reductase
MSHVQKKNEVYKCSICGNVVVVTTVGGGELVCCGQPMEHQEEKVSDQDRKNTFRWLSRLMRGESKNFRWAIAHPMTAEHYIEWIEVISAGRSWREFLQPGEQPVREFAVPAAGLVVRIYCNLHGLWRNQA